MVSSSHVGGLAARAVFYMSSHNPFTSKATYDTNTVAAIKTLQGWYDQGTGLWDTTGWWNSANCLTMLADYAVQDRQSANSLSIPNVIQNTYNQAQQTTMQATKVINPAGLPVSTYVRLSSRSSSSDVSKRGFSNFLNDYYDDEGWWALACKYLSS
jgi:hypothetical protein